MSFLDMRTVIISYAISNLICMIVIAVLWYQNRRRYAGIGCWLADFAMQWGAVVLIALRGFVPDFLSMTVSNAMVVGGTILLYIGFERFVGKRVRQIHNYIFLGVFTVVHVYFVYAQPSLAARNIIFSLGLLVICSQCVWFLFRRAGREMQPVTGGVGIILVLFCIVSILRIAFDLIVPVQNDFFHSDVYDTASVLVYQMLFILLTLTLFLMVNRRLVAGLNLDIDARKQVEQALRESEANFREVFDNTAHGIFIIEVTEDGNFHIGISNQAEQDATTIRREDVMGKLLEDVFPAEIAKALHDNYSRCMKAGHAIAYEEEINLPGVGRRYYYTTLAPVRDESARIYRIIGSTLEITDRKRMEEALQQSEEKFYKAFQASPDAILISRTGDGRIIEVNDGFCRLSGYTREEALSSSSIALGLWINPQDRDKVIAELLKGQKVQEREFDFRTKSGRILNCAYSGELIRLGGEQHILSVVRDITESKQAEEVVRMRLRLWEYAGTHSIDELMQKALDEIGDLTDSPIGFYHFVNEDQVTLTLQAWSTRTLAEFCRAEGRGLHYPINEAGVWVDCVRERKPVIHNDYAALSHRKGLPAGHAEVIRELVVPTMRGERVVAVLGVGNKPAHYDEKDTELVAYIADIVWTIVEQKRANDQIVQLNSKLERLAMTDDLTGLANRRSFFGRGQEEVRRSRRYKTPLSVLMLDIDEFKKVNDSYGHDTGDLVLQCVTHTLQENVREIDILARLGGEEFGVLLPNTGLQEAAQLGERLRAAVEKEVCTRQNLSMKVTMSVGVAGYSREMLNIDAMLRIADQAMYQAKNLGRNRVVLLN